MRFLFGGDTEHNNGASPESINYEGLRAQMELRMAGIRLRSARCDLRMARLRLRSARCELTCSFGWFVFGFEMLVASSDGASDGSSSASKCSLRAQMEFRIARLQLRSVRCELKWSFGWLVFGF